MPGIMNDPGPCPYRNGDILELNDGVRLRMTGLYGEDQNGVYGAILSHDRGDGTRCSGVVHWDIAGQRMQPTWTIKQWKPLTCEPSFQCGGCKDFHGFIREGKWVNA